MAVTPLLAVIRTVMLRRLYPRVVSFVRLVVGVLTLLLGSAMATPTPLHPAL